MQNTLTTPQGTHMRVAFSGCVLLAGSWGGEGGLKIIFNSEL